MRCCCDLPSSQRSAPPQRCARAIATSSRYEDADAPLTEEASAADAEARRQRKADILHGWDEDSKPIKEARKIVSAWELAISSGRG